MISIARKRTLTGILAASFGALGVALATGAGTVAPSYEEGVKVGDKAPDFTLTDIHGEEHKLSEYTEEGKIVVLEWFNPDCPFVKKFHYKTDTMRQTYAGFEGKPVEFLAINSASAPNKQGWGEERNIEAEEQVERGARPPPLGCPEALHSPERPHAASRQLRRLRSLGDEGRKAGSK